jgi:phage baseplate assembly protein W
MASNPNAFGDAELTNDSDRSSVVFKDFNFNFERHPVTGDIAKLTDISSVKSSVKNLILTNYYERGFHPEIGSNVRSALFENVTPMIAARLGRNIEDVVNNFEPRADLISVTVRANIDANAYEASIKFNVVNSQTDEQTINLFLERLR